jgi:hypothetical protein
MARTMTPRLTARRARNRKERRRGARRRRRPAMESRSPSQLICSTLTTEDLSLKLSIPVSKVH